MIMIKYILYVIIFFLSIGVYGQEAEFSLSTIQTEAEKQAISFAIEVLNEKGNLAGGVWASNRAKTDKAAGTVDLNRYYGGISLKPNIEIEAGSEDAFESLVAKTTINIYKYRYKKIGNLYTPKSDEFFHIFPISAGIESDAGFHNVNGLVEAGWVPWFQGMVKDDPLLSDLFIGVFIQGGQKWEKDLTPETGDQLDESLEEEGEELFRLKTKARWSVKTKGQPVMGYDISIKANGTLWRNLINSAWYSKLEGVLQLHVSANSSIDFKYEKGSGAPNFNEGEQYGVGLTLTF